MKITQTFEYECTGCGATSERAWRLATLQLPGFNPSTPDGWYDYGDLGLFCATCGPALRGVMNAKLDELRTVQK